MGRFCLNVLSQWRKGRLEGENLNGISTESRGNLDGISTESQGNLDGISTETRRNLDGISTESRRNLDGVLKERISTSCLDGGKGGANETGHLATRTSIDHCALSARISLNINTNLESNQFNSVKLAIFIIYYKIHFLYFNAYKGSQNKIIVARRSILKPFQGTTVYSLQ